MYVYSPLTIASQFRGSQKSKSVVQTPSSPFGNLGHFQITEEDSAVVDAHGRLYTSSQIMYST